MKKSSRTVERQPAETMGIDLGDKLSQYVILNEDGLAVEEGSFRNQAASIAKHFGNRGRMRIALEVGTRQTGTDRPFPIFFGKRGQTDHSPFFSGLLEAPSPLPSHLSANNISLPLNHFPPNSPALRIHPSYRVGKKPGVGLAQNRPPKPGYS